MLVDHHPASYLSTSTYMEPSNSDMPPLVDISNDEDKDKKYISRWSSKGSQQNSSVWQVDTQKHQEETYHVCQ